MQEVIAGTKCPKLERLLTKAEAWTNLHASCEFIRFEINGVDPFMYWFYLVTLKAQDITPTRFLKAIQSLDEQNEVKLEWTNQSIPSVGPRKDVTMHTFKISTTKRINLDIFLPEPPDPINPL